MDNNIKVTIWPPFRATFAKKSKEYSTIIANGGIKMPFEKQKEYVERLFLPRVNS